MKYFRSRTRLRKLISRNIFNCEYLKERNIYGPKYRKYVRARARASKQQLRIYPRRCLALFHTSRPLLNLPPRALCTRGSLEYNSVFRVHDYCSSSITCCLRYRQVLWRFFSVLHWPWHFFSPNGASSSLVRELDRLIHAILQGGQNFVVQKFS